MRSPPWALVPLLILPVTLIGAETPAPTPVSPVPVSASPATVGGATAPTPSPVAHPLPSVQVRVVRSSVRVSHPTDDHHANPLASGIDLTLEVVDIPGWRILEMDDAVAVQATMVGGEAVTIPPMQVHHHRIPPWVRENLMLTGGGAGFGGASAQADIALGLPTHPAMAIAQLQVKGTILAVCTQDFTHVPVALTAGTVSEVTGVPDEPMSFLLQADGTIEYRSPCYWVPLLADLHLRDAHQQEVARTKTNQMSWGQMTITAAGPVASIDLEVMTTARKLPFVATIGPIPLLDAQSASSVGTATVTDGGSVDLMAAIRAAAGGIPRIHAVRPRPPLPPAAKQKPGANF